MINKTEINKGSRVLVKTRNYVADPWSIKEGTVLDSQSNCILVQFRLFKIIPYTKWITVQTTSYFDVVLQKKDEEKNEQ